MGQDSAHRETSTTGSGDETGTICKIELTLFDGFRQRDWALERKLSFIASHLDRSLKYHALFNPSEQWYNQNMHHD